MDGHANDGQRQAVPAEQRDRDASTLPPENTPEFYLENGYVVFSEAYHLKRGSCCGSGCRHCPFTPRHQAGATTPATETGAAVRRSA